jgi:hypothetical protein
MEGRLLMTDRTAKRQLPLNPHAGHLRKEAKARLASLRGRMPGVRLSDVQLILAREYGFPNWGTLQAEVTRRSGQGRRISNAVTAILSFRRLQAHGDPEHDTLSFFQAGLVAQVSFIVVALTGVAMVMVYGRHQSLAALLHKFL